MLRLIVIFGIISGLIASSFFWILHPSGGEFDFDSGALLGYATMTIAFLTIPFAVMRYRDKEMGGQINFLSSMKVGLLITLVAALIYSVSWEIYLATKDVDFAGQYASYMEEKYVEKGLEADAIEAKMTKLHSQMETYQNNRPFRIAMTIMEVLPAGLFISLLSAVFLGFLPNRRRRRALAAEIE